MGTFRQSREPRENVRGRRNSQAFQTGFGIVTTAGGLETTGEGELQIMLDTDPGLELSASGLTAVVTDPVTLGASGIGLNTGDGLTLSSGALIANLGDGMTIVSGAIEPNPGEGIAVGATISVDVNGLTAEASVDGANDYFLMYDASVGALRKVLGDDLPGGGGSASPMTTLGDIEVYDGSAVERLGVGADNEVLTADSSQPLGVKWASPASGSSPTTTKGDLEVYNGTSLVRLPVGTDDQVLTADSSVAEGVAWKDASGGGGGSTAYDDKLTADLEGYWLLDETSGSTAADSSGNSNDGTYTNTGDITLDDSGAYIAGEDDAAPLFGGSSGHVDLGNPASIDFTPTNDDFTVIVWFRVEADSEVQGAVVTKTENDPGTNQFYLLLTADGDRLAVRVGDDNLRDFSPISGQASRYDDGLWHCAGVVVQGGTFRLWWDGSPGLDTFAAGPDTTTEPWRIAARGDPSADSGFHFEANIGRVRIYSRALSDNEMRVLALGSSVG